MAEPEEEAEVEIELLNIQDLPVGRLQDIYKKLDDESKKPISFNFDAIIPAGDKGFRVFQTFLLKMQKSVETLSLRFLDLSPESIDFFIEWILTNDHLKTIYIMGNSIATDEKKKEQLTNAWKKNLDNHRTDNMGNTFIRIYIDPNAPVEEEA